MKMNIYQVCQKDFRNDVYAHHFQVIDGILYFYEEDESLVCVIKDWTWFICKENDEENE